MGKTITFEADIRSLSHTIFRKLRFDTNSGRWERDEKRFWRKDGLKVYQFIPNDSSEFVRFDFTKAVRETVSTMKVNNQLRSIVVDSIYYRSIMGMNYLNFRFMGDVLNDRYGGSGVDVSDSIGINHFGLMGPESFLIGAKINGKKYGTILSVDQQNSLHPTQYAFSQNYPNPFNPATQLQFALPKSEVVMLKIYDALGREVAVLVNEQKDAGTYSVRWNASQFASGVYFAKMTAGSFTSTKKLMLIK